MKIIICDDQPMDRDALSELLNEYLRLRSLRAETVLFPSAQSLLEGPHQADIYILDIIMPDTDGIELGRALRREFPDAPIIYLTSSPDFALDAFSVRAFSYILKPPDREKLFSELDECLRRVSGRRVRVDVRVTGQTRYMSLPVDEVAAVEYSNHRLIYHLTGGRSLQSTCRRGSFEEIAEYFHSSPGFLKISSSHIVNLGHIRQLAGDDFLMDDGSRFHITRSYAGAKTRYLDYLMA